MDGAGTCSRSESAPHRIPESDSKSRQHVAVDQELRLQREIYAEHRKRLDARAEKLEIRRRGLEEKRARYNKHIQDGKERCKAAYRRAKNELEIIAVKEAEVVALEEELAVVKEALRARQEYSQKLVGYQDFLQAAVDESDEEFETMEDLLSKYYILLQTKKDLKYRINKVQEDIGNSRSATMHLRQNHMSELLHVGNRMTKLREGICENRAGVSRTEEALEGLRVGRRDAILEFGTLKLATNNVYHVLVQYRARAGFPAPRAGVVPDSDLEAQLVKVAEYVADLRTVAGDVGPTWSSSSLLSSGVADGSAAAVRGSKPPLLV